MPPPPLRQPLFPSTHKLCRQGIAHRLYVAMAARANVPLPTHEVLEALVCAIQEEPDGQKVYDALIEWSLPEISAEVKKLDLPADETQERGKS